MSTKLEIDVRGLLAHCEELASDDDKDWRLKKYIKSLDTMIQELQDSGHPSEKLMEEYRNRCTGLKLLTNYVEPSPKIGLKSKGRDVVKEISQIHQAKYTNALRSDLFDGNGMEDDILWIS